MEEKTFYIDLTNIRNFYKSVLYNHNASREEVYNYLHECLKFVFIINEIDLNNYKVILHSPKQLLSAKQGAYMYKFKSNEFHVFFLKEEMRVEEFTDRSITKLLRLTINAFHEFGHVMQYVINPTYMSNVDYTFTESYNNINEFLATLDKKSAKLVVKQFLKHEESNCHLSKVEKDANWQSFDYFKSLINALQSTETDPYLQHFYEIVLVFINKNKKYKHEDYRAFNKINKESVRKLKSYGVDDTMLLK